MINCANCGKDIEEKSAGQTARKYCSDYLCKRDRVKKDMRAFRAKAGPGHEKRLKQAREAKPKRGVNICGGVFTHFDIANMAIDRCIGDCR